jgi:hypothetical protein
LLSYPHFKSARCHGVPFALPIKTTSTAANLDPRSAKYHERVIFLTYATAAPKISFICALVNAASTIPKTAVRAIVMPILRSVLLTWYRMKIVKAGNSDAQKIAAYLKTSLVVWMKTESL